METPRILKRSLIALSSLLLLSCGTMGTVKVYYLDPPVGLVRKQQNEVKPFSEAKGFICESPQDFEDTVACVGGAVKVYYLDPLRGLVREQQHEVKPFPTVKGYFCTSPTDFQKILERCPAKAPIQ